MNKTKLIIFSALILTGVLLLSGCSSPASSTKPWSVSALGYAYSNVVYTTFSSLTPADGNTWLIVNFRVRNNTSQTYYINWIADDTVTYVSPGGTSYDNIYSDVSSDVNALPDAYTPGQTQEGYVYIEIPATEDVTQGQLLFHFDQECDFVIDMAGLPTFTY